MSTIAILGTTDTKGAEHAFVAECIRKRGHRTLVIDVGSLGEPAPPPDITREAVAAAGNVDLPGILTRRDRGEVVAAMSRCAPIIVSRLVAERRIQGVISLGGGGGTAIATAAMRALPLGFPKVMVSTLANGNTAHFVAEKDIVMFPSVVDIAGLNDISLKVLGQAAGAICGMVEAQPMPTSGKPIIAASQFGNTTPCVDAARRFLEEAGYQVIVFASVGSGGRTMESLIDAGMVTGVLDITTTEWADQLVGGILPAGPTRLEAAARRGVPAVVSTGCLDMVNFGPPETVPAKFQGRKFYQHNPQVTLMRTTVEENRELGRIVAQKLNLSTGPVTVLLPLRGGSMLSAPGQPFHDSAVGLSLYFALKSNLRPDIPVLELDCSINDNAFPRACAGALLNHLQKKATTVTTEH